MKNYLNKILFVLCCAISQIVISQPLSFEENQRAHRHYWYYRTRMINDFIKIGDEQGDCIVLAERNQGVADVTSKVGADQIDITNQYLSALAIEYKLLKRNNQNTYETIKEIFYLIKTLNRLDSKADLFWDSSPPTNENLNSYSETDNLNGFFLREDMPSYYLPNNLAHYNYELLEHGYNGSAGSVPHPLNTYKSFTGLQFTSNLDNDNQFSNFRDFGYGSKLLNRMSCPHDKYYSMFAAFMFIVKYLPPGTEYKVNGIAQVFQDGEADIRTEVRNIANRCHLYLRGNLFPPHASSWVMAYPDGSHNDTELGIPQPFSYPITRTICHINDDFPWSPVGCVAYSDIFAESSYNAFGALCLTSGITEDLSVFVAHNQTTSNIPINVVGIPTPMWAVMDINSSIKSVEWSDLLRMVLHETGSMLKSKATFANPINEAPCKGPYNFNNIDDGYFDNAGYEWSSQDRLEHPSSRLNPKPFPGNYPGVDYMLLHNLYYEYLNQLDDEDGGETAAYKNAYNFMDNEDRSVWPKKIGPSLTDIVVGVNNTDASHVPANVKVFQNLISSAHIYASASPLAPTNSVPSQVEYRAGKEIDFEPGFEVEAGSDFHAYIKRYVCGEDDYEAGMRTARDSSGTSNSNDYENDAMNSVAMHYVDYPKSYADKNPVNYNNNNLTTSNNAQSEVDITVIPNPTSGVFSVQTKKIKDSEKLTISVFDAIGNLILNIDDVDEKTEINLQNYSKGIYIIRLSSNIGNNKIKKVSLVD